MQVPDAQHDLRDVEARKVLIQAPLLLQVEEHLPAAQVGQHEVQLGGRLEGVLQLDEEGVVDGLQDGPLGLKTHTK